MASVIVVTYYITILTFVERALGLLANEIISETGAMDHLLRAKILNEIIAGNGADDGQMIVVFGFGFIGRTAGEELLMFVSIQVNCDQELALAVLAIDAARAFFGADPSRRAALSWLAIRLYAYRRGRR